MTHKFRKISVVGLGYIGLPTATMFASKGVEVVGVDVNKTVIETVNRGDIHIVEPNLRDLVKTVVRKGYLKAVKVPEPSEVFIIAVPTPFKDKSHTPDLSYVKSAIKAIAPVLQPKNLIILESTSPVGTTEKLACWLAKERPDLTFPHQVGEISDISIAYCPERVLPGDILNELISNDRVIGGMTMNCSRRACDLYSIFVTGRCHVASNTRVAELAKISENSFRDVNIAFANELAQISNKFEIDPWELITLANRHPRVNILQPGPGVGGHCIAVDPWFIISSAPEDCDVIYAARMKNLQKPNIIVASVSKLASKFLEKKIICLGLSYKPNIDDMRESPSYQIFDQLCEKYGNRVEALEPNMEKNELKRINISSIDEVMSSENIIVLLVGHKEFADLRPKSKFVIEAIGIWR